MKSTVQEGVGGSTPQASGQQGVRDTQSNVEREQGAGRNHGRVGSRLLSAATCGSCPWIHASMYRFPKRRRCLPTLYVGTSYPRSDVGTPAPYDQFLCHQLSGSGLRT